VSKSICGIFDSKMREMSLPIPSLQHAICENGLLSYLKTGLSEYILRLSCRSAPCEGGEVLSESVSSITLNSAMSRPKAVIFDLGGVLITSPLKAIEEFETENDIPHGYLNYAMFRPLTTSLTVAPPPNPMLGLNWKQALYRQMRHFIHDGMSI
jgi:hypothetical protein